MWLNCRRGYFMALERMAFQPTKPSAFGRATVGLGATCDIRRAEAAGLLWVEPGGSNPIAPMAAKWHLSVIWSFHELDCMVAYHTIANLGSTAMPLRSVPRVVLGWSGPCN